MEQAQGTTRAATAQAGSESDALVKRFVESVERGVDAWKDAGAALVKLSEVDPQAIERIKAKAGFTSSNIKTFMAIGRGELLPSLMAASSTIKRLPVADQQRVVDGTVEALVLKHDGTTETVIVDMMRASSDVIKQVVGRDGLRSLSEQKAVIVARSNADVARKQAECKAPNGMPWRVDGKTIVVTASVKLTNRDLLAMMKAIS